MDRPAPGRAQDHSAGTTLPARLSSTQRGRGEAPLSEFAVDLDFIRNDEIASHRYYQEFLGRFGLRWFAGIPIRPPEGVSALSVQRKAVRGPFSVRE